MLSNFLKEKLELKAVTLNLIKDLKAKNDMNVKRAKCDNATENEDFKRACK